MKPSHKGFYTPQNPLKYRGNTSEIVYRSSWEAGFMYWLDVNDKVKSWSSEQVVVPYISPADNQVHRYIVDFMVETDKGVFLIEIKPQKETLPPVPHGRGRTKDRFGELQMLYEVNTAKWKAAEEYAKANGYKFFVYDEVTLRQLGVPLPTKKKEIT